MALGPWVQPHEQAACIPVTQDPARGTPTALSLLPATSGCRGPFPTADPHRGGGHTSGWPWGQAAGKHLPPACKLFPGL